MAPNRYIENTHVTVDEYACRHCGKLPPDLLDEDGEMGLVYQVLFRGYEAIRAGRGGAPLVVTDGYRCREAEQESYDRWVAAGKPGAVHGFLSVHMFGLAMDLRATSWADQSLIVSLARRLRPKPRIGWKQYKTVGSMTVHIDYGQLIDPSPTTSFKAGVEW